MIKGVNSAPTKASLSLKETSPKKASAKDALNLEKPQTEVSELSPNTNSHITVLLEEAVQALAIKADGVYVDGTFGRGGHSRKILEQLGGNGRLIAFDRDLKAIESSKEITDPRFSMVHSHSAGMQAELSEMGVSKVDGILLDLGISSPQIDDASRGFSF